MKKLGLIILILIISKSYIYAEGESFISPSLDNISNNFEFQDLDKMINDELEDKNLANKKPLKQLALDIIKGESLLNKESIYTNLKSSFLKEIKLNISMLWKIFIIALLSSILRNIQATFEQSSIGEIANYVIYILISTLIIQSFTQTMLIMGQSIEKMTNIMSLLLPIIMSFLIITSGPNARILFHPMLLGTVNIVGVLVKNIIIPLITFSFILSIVSNLSSGIELNKLSDLSRKIIIYIISIGFTIFIGVLTIYGFSNKIDGLSIRTAKFAVDKFIPIVGGFLSDAVDTVISSSAILKNGIGIIGLSVLILIIMTPLVKITSILLIYGLIAAMIQPIVDKNITNLFTDVSKTLVLVLITTLSIGSMFFITITMLVDTGNSLLMLR